MVNEYGSMPNVVENIVKQIKNPKTQNTNPKSKSQNPNPKTQRNPKSKIPNYDRSLVARPTQ